MPLPVYGVPPLAPAVLPLTCRVRRGAPQGPLLVLLHGAGSTELALAPLLRRLPVCWNVVLVRAPRAMPRGGFFWYPVHFRRRGVHVDARQVEQSLRRLGALLDQLPAVCTFDAERVCLAGFSQGAALASAFALKEPQRVAAVGMLGGRLLSQVQAQPLLVRGLLPRLRFFVGHGLHDPVLPVALAVQATRWLRHHGVQVTARAYAAGHEATPAMLQGLVQWLTSRALPPLGPAQAAVR